MCNLSEWIEEDALKRGEKKGRAKGRAEGRIEGKAEGRAEGKAEAIFAMYKKGYPVEQIADIMDKSVDETASIIEKMEKNEPLLV